MAGLRLKIKNPDISKEEYTNLTADYSSGTTLTVSSNDDFAANDKFVVGSPGEDQTETATVQSIPAGTTGITTTSALKFPHASGTPIFRSLYDQISLERKPTAGAYAQITEGLINIDVDSKDGFTIIAVAAGVSTDTYKWRFYNSTSGTYSAYSDELAGTGAAFNSVGRMVSEVRTFAGIEDHESVTDEQIITWFNDCQDRIEANYDRWWFLLTETTNLIVASTYKYALPTDFARMEALLFDDTQLNYRLSFATLEEFDQLRVDDATASTNDTGTWWTLLPPDGTSTKGYFGVHPTPKTAGAGRQFTVRYYKEMATLDSAGDTTAVPMPEVLVHYAMSQYYKTKESQLELADYYYQLYLDGIALLKKLNRREVGQAELFKWRGYRGRSKLFGARAGIYSDTYRENYW